jgi:uncharacterized protein YneF (UPF0154 family)
MVSKESTKKHGGLALSIRLRTDKHRSIISEKPFGQYASSLSLPYGIVGVVTEGCDNILQTSNHPDPKVQTRNNVMSYPPSEYGPDPESSPDFADCDKSHDAWKACGQRARENSVPLILLALVVGALLGAFLSRRKKKQKDAVEAAREWLEAAYAQLAQKLPQLAEKLAHAKKPSVPRCQAAFLDQAQQVAKKLKWW